MICHALNSELRLRDRAAWCRWRFLIVLLGSVSIVATSALAASPSMHHCVHEDAHSEQHVCAIVLFSKDQLLTSNTGIAVPVDTDRIWSLGPIPETPDLVSPDSSSPPERGPPV